jgi:peptidoglycan-N-acetylglucosamine deacetylase
VINFRSISFSVLIFLALFPSASFAQMYQEMPVPIQRYSTYAEILWHGNRNLPEVALTFDDGPGAQYTPQVLDVLKKYGVKATFFVLGENIEKNTGIVSREAAEGHEIGNHTYTHLEEKRSDVDFMRNEIINTNILIKKFTGRAPKYFRPPYGLENWRFLDEAELLNYSIILWTVDVRDWDPLVTRDDISTQIVKEARNGSIILLHDGGTSREAMIEALPAVIDGLRQKGLSLVTIDEMVEHLKYRSPAEEPVKERLKKKLAI